MKKILLFSLFIVFGANAQENLKWNAETASISNSKAVQAPGKSADEIYNLTQKWFLNTFKNAGKVIQYENAEANIIEGKYTASYPYMMSSVPFYHIIKIEAKEGRFKVSIDPGNRVAGAGDFESYVVKSNGEPLSVSKKLWAKAEEETNDLISSLENAIINPSKSEEW
jgi:hypothetical protein